MRISDWSSDVGSSDLRRRDAGNAHRRVGMACARRGPVRAGSPPWARSLRGVGLRRLTPLLADQRLLACIFARLAHSADVGHVFVLLESARPRHVGLQSKIGRASCEEGVCKYVYMLG